MTNRRIPADLQEIFLAVNQGEEIHKPPPPKSSFRAFKNALKAGIKRFKVLKESNAPRSASMCTVSSVTRTVLAWLHAAHYGARPSESVAMSHDESESTFITDGESEREEENWLDDDESLIEELDDLFARYGRARY